MKTTFVSLFFNTAIANLSVPDGVLDQLINKKKQEDRIVFLTSSLYDGKLKRFYEKGVIPEYFDRKFDPRGFFERAFQFFYSYLIYTGTTRILSTFGARTDAPPAGGNRYLSFLKSLIANIFGRFKFIKVKFVPWMYSIVFYERPFGDVFKKYKPTVVFSPNIALFPDIEIVAESRRNGVLSVGMACNWDHLNKYYIPVHADILLIQNEPMKKEAVELHVYKESEVFIVGFPQFDVYTNLNKYLMSREEFFGKFNLDPKKRLILFISGAAYALDEPDILKEISGWIRGQKFNEKNLALMVRPYVVLRDRKSEEEKYKDLVGDSNVAFNWFFDGNNFENKKFYINMLYYSDLMISVFSTTAIEASILDKPNIILGFDGLQKRPFHQSVVRLEQMSHFRHVLDLKSIPIARDFGGLFNLMNNYLDKPNTDKEKRKHLVDILCGGNDGNSSERVVDFIIGGVGGKNGKSK